MLFEEEYHNKQKCTPHFLKLKFCGECFYIVEASYNKRLSDVRLMLDYLKQNPRLVRHNKQMQLDQHKKQNQR